MSALTDWMKEVYTKAKNNELEWKPLYANNYLKANPEGIYTDMNFRKNDKYQYIKLTVQYQSRCDSEGVSHPEEGTKYYVLHSLKMEDLDEKIGIPEPSDDHNICTDEKAALVNNYGRFRSVFDDEETAKSAAGRELIRMLYPFQYILSDEELEDWNSFLKANS